MTGKQLLEEVASLETFFSEHAKNYPAESRKEVVSKNVADVMEMAAVKIATVFDMYGYNFVSCMGRVFVPTKFVFKRHTFTKDPEALDFFHGVCADGYDISVKQLLRDFVKATDEELPRVINHFSYVVAERGNCDSCIVSPISLIP